MWEIYRALYSGEFRCWKIRRTRQRIDVRAATFISEARHDSRLIILLMNAKPAKFNLSPRWYSNQSATDSKFKRQAYARTAFCFWQPFFDASWSIIVVPFSASRCMKRYKTAQSGQSGKVSYSKLYSAVRGVDCRPMSYCDVYERHRHWQQCIWMTAV